MFDFTAPLPRLGLFFGRIGNFINGELWGKATTVPWGFNVNGEVRHPSQLYEACFEGICSVHGRVDVLVASAAAVGVRRAVSSWSTAWRASSWSSCGCPDEHIGYLAGGWVTDGAGVVVSR